MSEIENTLEISAIKEDLKKKITFPEMTDAQKRQVVDQLFPDGVAFWYEDPKAVSGDKVFGWGDPTINSGGFFFSELTSTPSGAPTEANMDFKFRS